MVFKLSRCLLAMALLLCLTTLAFALDDDTSDDDDDDDDDDDENRYHVEGTANGEFPINLAPDAAYAFAFDVFNDNGGPDAIQEVLIALPTTSYSVLSFDEQIEGLHFANRWYGSYNPYNATLLWESFGTVTSRETGDIYEGDMLTFSFVAVTDQDATDGFAWVLTGAATVNTGTWYFGGPDDDDDFTDDDFTDDDDDVADYDNQMGDDDTDEGGSDGDDSAGDDGDGGCGC